MRTKVFVTDRKIAQHERGNAPCYFELDGHRLVDCTPKQSWPFSLVLNLKTIPASSKCWATPSVQQFHQIDLLPKTYNFWE
jgi:hypothetical protein